jgi:hypothetical protein
MQILTCALKRGVPMSPGTGESPNTGPDLLRRGGSHIDDLWIAGAPLWWPGKSVRYTVPSIRDGGPMHIPRIRQTSLAPALAARDRQLSGHWRLALLASVGLWAVIATAIGAVVGN